MLAINLSALISLNTLKGATKCSNISNAVTVLAFDFLTVLNSVSKSSP